MTDQILPFEERVRLVELVDRVLDRGVVLRGDVTISVAGIDLVYLELHLLLTAVETMARRAVSAPDDPASQVATPDPIGDSRSPTDRGAGP